MLAVRRVRVQRSPVERAVRPLSARARRPSRRLEMPASTRSRWLELWLPLLIIVLDQLTKALVRQRLPVHASVAVIPGFLDFTHVRNTGAAFGMLNAVDFPFKTALLAVVATAALIGVGF